MAAKKNGNTPELGQNEIRLAYTDEEGNEYERLIKLAIPRGKQYQEKHLRLLQTFAPLEVVSEGLESGQTGLTGIINAIVNLFNDYKDFDSEMVPFALRMEGKEDREFLDMLTPMEKFMAYMQAASFIVEGGKAAPVQAALKK